MSVSEKDGITDEVISGTECIVFLPAAKHAGLWIIIGPICCRLNHLKEAFTSQRNMGK